MTMKKRYILGLALVAVCAGCGGVIQARFPRLQNEVRFLEIELDGPEPDFVSFEISDGGSYAWQELAEGKYQMQIRGFSETYLPLYSATTTFAVGGHQHVEIVFE